MTVITCLLIGNQTWELQERSITSLRACHPDQDIIVYYSLGEDKDLIIKTLVELDVEAVDIGRPGLIDTLRPSDYSEYNTLDFNIKTSFKWQAILGAMASRLDDVIFIDADIAIVSSLPFSSFQEIWKHYDIFVQDEGNQILPKHPCTGFIGFKFNEANIALLETLHQEQCTAIVSGMSQHDQTIFAQHISRDIEIYKKVYFLPQLLFPVGYMAPIFSRVDKAKINGVGGQQDPYIYHANWIVGVKAKSVLMDAMLASKPTPKSDDKRLFIEYLIGKFTIKLPKDHLLPVYQASHPRYDKFLPQLAEILPENSTVIDVGANCGDSLAGMASANCRLNFICIEADKAFFSLLQSNIEDIKRCEPSLSIESFNALIGKKLRKAHLLGSGGTKSAVASTSGKDAVDTRTLDSLLVGRLKKESTISLLKVDTDGWDFDVINSATGIISQHCPIIFFECQYSDDEQFHGFLDMMRSLEQLGYTTWYVFDNFGEFIIKADSLDTINSLAGYILRQNQGMSTRTIYYMDILATPTSFKDQAEAAIASYKSFPPPP